MKSNSLSSSHLNSHMVKLFFKALNVLKHKHVPNSLQLIIRMQDQGTVKILGSTEILELGQAVYGNFQQGIDVEFVFKKKQVINIDLLFDGTSHSSCSLSLGELIGSKTNQLTIPLPQDDGFEGQVRVVFEGTKSLEQSMNANEQDKEMFFDYLSSDLNISVIAAIDFTASNGYYHLPNSLHHLNPGYLNDYQAVITSVCEVLLNYDSDKLI